jgi:hypothetical protein
MALLRSVGSGDGRVSISSPVGRSLTDAGAVISVGSVVAIVISAAAEEGVVTDIGPEVKCEWCERECECVCEGQGEVMVVRIRIVESAASARDESATRSSRSIGREANIADP